MLKSIKEHNEERMKPIFVDRLTGIACPKCGTEVVFTAPNINLLSNPPKRNIGCTKCRWYGTCLA